MLERVAYRLIDFLPERPVSWLRTSPTVAPFLERVVSIASRPLHGRTLTIRNGEAAGLVFRIGPVSTVWASGRIELAVQRALREVVRPGDVFFDIGANVGFFAILGGRLVGPSGTVVAFEPLDENVVELRANVQLNRFSNVVVQPQAVSDSSGPRWLTADHRATASLRANSAGRARLVRVSVTTVDDFVRDHPHLAPDVIKIDVEGHESYVLRGMRRTLLERGPILVCELHGTSVEFAAALAEAGYSSTLLESPGPVAQGKPGAHVIARPAGR